MAKTDKKAAKAKAKAEEEQAKLLALKKAQAAAQDSSDSDSSDSSSEDEAPAKKVTASKKKAPVKEDSSSDSDSSSEDEAPAKKAVPAKKKAAESDSDSSSDSSSEEEVEQPKKAVAKKNDSDSDSDSSTEEEDEAPKKKTMEVDSDSDSDSSSEEEVDQKKMEVDAAKVGGSKRKLENAASSDSDSSDSSDDSEDEQEEAPKATEEPPKKFMKVDTPQPAGEHVVLVKAMSFNATEDDIRAFFQGVAQVEMEYFEDSGKFRGVAKVSFNTAEDAQAALDQTGADMMGRTISVYPFKGKKQQIGGSNHLIGQTRALFMGNLPFDVTEDDIYDTLGQFGTITRVSLPTDRETGQFKGFGIVNFDSPDAVKNAMEQNGSVAINGRYLRLDPSEEREKREGGFNRPQGGGFNRQRGGGRGGPRGGSRGGRGRGGRGGNSQRGGFNKPRVQFGSNAQNKKISFD